jgi:membrane fusion protein
LASEKQLFRREAIEAKQTRWLGNILLTRPLSFSLLTAISAGLALTLIAFLIIGSYTKRSTAGGQLVSSLGQLKVYTPQNGVVLKNFVEEGQFVESGAHLLTISNERYGSDLEPIQAGISEKFSLQRMSLIEEIERQKMLQLDELKNRNNSVISLKNELSSLAAQLNNQHELVALAADAVSRYSGLLKKGYISVDEFQQRQFELLGQKKIKQHLKRQHTELQQKLTEHQTELSGLSARHENQLASIYRILSNVEQQLAENEARRTFLITAPKAGIVTAVLVEAGQAVDASRSLLSIIPTNSRLQAELYVPSKTIGFMKAGDDVLIRYQAYPYQKFGLHPGKIQSISRTTLSTTELASLGGTVAAIGQHGEQLYRIRVNINEQNIMAYGEYLPLQAGMLIEADIFQETRNLYEWLLEPLYSITGKL